MNIPLDEVIFFDAITSHPTTGAATDADSTPTFAVYEESTDTDIGVGGNLTKRTSLTGNYRGTFTLSAANGFEVGKWYSVIGSATVNAIAGKAVLKNFRVVAAESTAGVLEVNAKNWGNAAVTGMPMPTYTQPTGFLAAVFPSDPADQSLIIAATDAVMTRLGAPASASIAADIATRMATYAQPAGFLAANFPAFVGDATEDNVTILYSNIASLTVMATAIQAVTDQFVFTIANQVNANALTGGGGGGGGGAVGPGSISWTVTVTDNAAVPIDGAAVWVSTNLAGTSVIAGTLYTNAFGVVTFLLDAGPYYLWVQHSRYNGTNPTAFTVA